MRHNCHNAPFLPQVAKWPYLCLTWSDYASIWWKYACLNDRYPYAPHLPQSATFVNVRHFRRKSPKCKKIPTFGSAALLKSAAPGLSLLALFPWCPTPHIWSKINGLASREQKLYTYSRLYVKRFSAITLHAVKTFILPASRSSCRDASNKF